MAKTPKKVPITERALIQRINRKLAEAGEHLHTCPESNPCFKDLGRYYIVDTNRNSVSDDRITCSLEKLGRRYGVLRPWETLAAGPKRRKG